MESREENGFGADSATSGVGTGTIETVASGAKPPSPMMPATPQVPMEGRIPRRKRRVRALAIAIAVGTLVASAAFLSWRLSSTSSQLSDQTKRADAPRRAARHIIGTWSKAWYTPSR